MPAFCWDKKRDKTSEVINPLPITVFYLAARLLSNGFRHSVFGNADRAEMYRVCPPLSQTFYKNAKTCLDKLGQTRTNIKQSRLAQTLSIYNSKQFFSHVNMSLSCLSLPPLSLFQKWVKFPRMTYKWGGSWDKTERASLAT